MRLYDPTQLQVATSFPFLKQNRSASLGRVPWLSKHNIWPWRDDISATIGKITIHKNRKEYDFLVELSLSGKATNLFVLNSE